MTDVDPPGTTSSTGEPRERRFARFAEARPTSEGYWPLPPDGLCLSSFVLLSPPTSPGEVLVGKILPDADWAQIGALDPLRVRLNASGWMIPSSHLLYFESPRDAAERILREQLGLDRRPLRGPEIFSEVYPPRRHPERGLHWDLEFVFRGSLDKPPPRHPAWSELKFVDPARTPRAAFTRSHDEVLELCGFSLG